MAGFKLQDELHFKSFTSCQPVITDGNHLIHNRKFSEEFQSSHHFISSLSTLNHNLVPKAFSGKGPENEVD